MYVNIKIYASSENSFDGTLFWVRNVSSLDTTSYNGIPYNLVLTQYHFGPAMAFTTLIHDRGGFSMITVTAVIEKVAKVRSKKAR